MDTIAVPTVQLSDHVAATDPQADVLRLFAEHGPSLYRFCRATLAGPDEAEDVVQETFLKLLQHVQRDGDQSNIRAWLFAVAANACRDRARWRIRWRPWREEDDTRTIDPFAAADADQASAVAAAALRRLAPRDRMLLSLRAQGLSYRDIATAAGIRETSVGRLLARAVDRWKRALSQGRPEGRPLQASDRS